MELTAAFVEREYNNRALVPDHAEYFARWIEGGGETLVHYSDIGIWSKYGFWGSLEHLAQELDDAPKYRALLDVIARYPRPSR